MRQFTSNLLAIAVLATAALAGPAHAADCGKVVDELSKAISGHLTMSTEAKVAAMRMTTKAYDHCMVGDQASADATRDMIMAQIRQHLGGK
jgi:hypothetical protein